MDDGLIDGKARQPALNSSLVKRWEARLNLTFRHRDGRSFLAKKKHYGPLVLQKSLYPEGQSVCHGIVIHPPGGVAGGDEIWLDVALENGANALLTTPGAGKWYKANGQYAKQYLDFKIDMNGALEWLPQENILFDGAKVQLCATVTLAENAKYAGWEILCFGRQAQKEQWKTGALAQKLQIKRLGKLIWNEVMALSPDNHAMQSIVGLNGNVVSGAFVIAAGAVPADVLDACRAVKPSAALDPEAKFAVTALPEIFSARYIGQSSQSAREYFELLWQVLRPWYLNREATRPRIWNT